jgi:ABC-type bacteriocin transporter
MAQPICIKQHDITDCGAACLASAAWYHNLKIPISKIREYAKTDRKGTNILGMIQAAERLGFAAKGVKGTPEALKEIPLPAIAHVVLPNGLHHFVVVYKITDKYILIADPAKGLEKMKPADFHAVWSGVLVLLAPHLEFQPGDKRDSHFQRFANLIKPYPSLLLECLLASLVYTILGLAMSKYVEFLLDDVFPNGNSKLLNILSIGMIGILVFKMLFGWARQSLLMYVANNIDATLILGYYKHILRLPQSFFDTRRVGEIISRVNDAVKIRTAISSASLSVIMDSLTLVFAFALMFTYSWKLTMIAVIVVPLFGALYLAFRKPIAHTQRGIMEKSSELESQLVSSITNMQTIRSFRAADVHNLKTETAFIDLLRMVRRSAYQSMTNSTISGAIGGLAFIALLWTGGSLVLDQQLSVGELMSFYTLIGYVISPASNLIGINQTVQDALIAADRLFEILSLETEEQTHQGQFLLQGATVESIRFEHVSFRYGTRAKVLDDLSFEIPTGTMTAIVGESGSGKSTIAKLLQGFYPPNEGKILFGAMNIQDIHLDEIRRYSSAVPQEVQLFHGTVLENITLGDMMPDYQKAMQICSFIGAADFIQKLPYSWNTVLGEFGADLSGGQRQRLAMARALYRSPNVLILDEATSALDSESEYAIQQALMTLRTKGLTTVVVAHRLSTIASADQILVMDSGRIIEQGTHMELLKMEGKYYSLWMRQMPLGTTKEALLTNNLHQAFTME